MKKAASQDTYCYNCGELIDQAMMEGFSVKCPMCGSIVY